jgi:class 3 adenylate cyclase
MDDQMKTLESSWGTGASLALLMPSLAGDETMREAWAKYERQSASPGRALGLLRMALDSDVRDVLSSISVPTLVMHRTGDRFISVDHGRYIAKQIPTAEYVEFEGEDHFPAAGDAGAILDRVERFVTGTIAPPSHERILAAILFTDIVGSTRRAVELGDADWSRLLDEHNSALREQLRLHRGHEVVSTGDGFLAIFDGPARAVRCARMMNEAVKPLGLEIRAGVHTGEVTVLDDNIAGISVHIAARVASLASAGEVLMTEHVQKLVLGEDLALKPYGARELKGIPGAWELFSLATSTAT